MPEMSWHELADLKHDLHELDIELRKTIDKISLTQNKVALMIELVDDLTINRREK